MRYRKGGSGQGAPGAPFLTFYLFFVYYRMRIHLWSKFIDMLKPFSLFSFFGPLSLNDMAFFTDAFLKTKRRVFLIT